jgi:hypothetical protein
MPRTTPSATSAGAASAQAISAFLPPSSRVSALSVALAPCITARPPPTLPIKPILATRGCATSAAPVSRPPVTTLNTPGGNTSDQSSASRSADSGVCSAGLTISTLPAASGAPHLPATKSSGWLNAPMRATTPSGSRTV